MRISKNITLGIAFLVAIIGISAIIFIYHLSTRSLPNLSGTVTIKELSEEVKIFRDDYGVPHIFANSEYDCFFAVGYTHAQDRLWQMELMQRIGEGKLSEIFGVQTVKIDKMFKTLGLSKLAVKLANNLDDTTKFALQAYADGVNYFINNNHGKYPIEFDILKIEPSTWSVEKSMLISRLMAWELNYARWVDLLCAELVNKFGKEKAMEIFPYWKDDAPFIIPPDYVKSNIAKNLYPFVDAEKYFRNYFNYNAFQSGSNAWAISSLKSATKKPIVANDPHLLLMIPARWYEIHIVSPKINVSGMSIAGVPFVVVGRNESIAWGVTNAMLDDCDYYYEEVDSLLHPTKYKFNNAWLPINISIDTIKVKDSDPIEYYIYSTHRGPIINLIEPNAEFIDKLISMKWVGSEISNEPAAFYKLNSAKNIFDFENALKLFTVPAQNFVYADTAGNIGYRTGGKIPIRKTKGPTLPFPGNTDEYDWHGFVPFEKMPHIQNPANGIIVTANNKIIDDSYPYHISNHWESPWRSMRINQYLNEQNIFSVDDMKKLQNDLVSIQAQEIAPYILHAYDSVEITNKNVSITLEYFKNWTYNMHSKDVATSLFQVTLTKLIFNIFHDKMGARLYGLYDTLASTPLSALSKIIKDQNSDWFDDWNTSERETRDMCIRKSVDDALEELQSLLGGELKEWQWGKIHTVTFKHVFGDNKWLSKFINVGPFPVGGSHSTVNVGHYFLAHPYDNAVGASMRQIMDLSDINSTYSVLPPGQSGQVFSDNYKDQVMLWLNGGYKTRQMNFEDIQKTSKNVLILKP